MVMDGGVAVQVGFLLFLIDLMALEFINIFCFLEDRAVAVVMQVRAVSLC